MLQKSKRSHDPTIQIDEKANPYISCSLSSFILKYYYFPKYNLE